MHFKHKINTHKINVKAVTKDTLDKVDEILNYLCLSFNVSLVSIRSKSRKKEIMIVKRYFCYFAYKHLCIQLREVANKVNLTNHTSVLYHRDTVEDLMNTDSKIRLQVYRLEKEITELIK